MAHAHQADEQAAVLVEVQRDGRRPLVMSYDDYLELEAEDLAGTSCTLFVRCACGARLTLMGPLAVVAAVMRRRGSSFTLETAS